MSLRSTPPSVAAVCGVFAQLADEALAEGDEEIAIECVAQAYRAFDTAFDRWKRACRSPQSRRVASAGELAGAF